MTEKDFIKFFDTEVAACRAILISKNADYSSGTDKLHNFKEAGKEDNITSIEALRGMDLKHRVSIRTGLDELQQGKVRPIGWWQEKVRDHINYLILLHALIYEIYFEE